MHLPTWDQERSDRSDLHYDCDLHDGDALSGGSVPHNRDFDCLELRSWGIVNIP
jgi:hypothetical protein